MIQNAYGSLVAGTGYRLKHIPIAVSFSYDHNFFPDFVSMGLHTIDVENVQMGRE